MKISEIPAGHVAVNNGIYPRRSIILVGKTYSMFLNKENVGQVESNTYFCNDYEDMGPLNVNLTEIKRFKVDVSVG